MPYALILRSTFATFALILFQTGLVFPSNASASQNPDSANVAAIDTFDVPEAKMMIIYPKGKPRSLPPVLSQEQNRLGSFASVTFDIKYDNLILYDILFQTLESCSTYVAYLQNLPIGGDAGCTDISPSVYLPEEFERQYRAFQNNDSLARYDTLTLGGKRYFYSCGYSEGGEVYMATGATFIDSIRITVQMLSNKPYNCDKVYDECKNLLSQIELKPYKPKKNDKR